VSTYRVMRFYQDHDRESEVVKRGLTLEEAQAHCKNPETSSKTCTSSVGKNRTKRRGPWFEGYTKE
jgi:hypothetical protein